MLWCFSSPRHPHATVSPMVHDVCASWLACPLSSTTLSHLGPRPRSRRSHCLFNSLFTSLVRTLPEKGKHGLKREDGKKEKQEERIHSVVCFSPYVPDMQAPLPLQKHQVLFICQPSFPENLGLWRFFSSKSQYLQRSRDCYPHLQSRWSLIATSKQT